MVQVIASAGHRILWLSICIVLLGACTASIDPVSPKTPAPPPDVPQIGAVAVHVPNRTDPPVAVMRLIEQAKMDIESGAYAAAFDNLERAIRIDPADPMAWHLLARAQLKQDNLAQAEQLAKKSNSLIVDNSSLEKHNWKIIAESLDRRGLTRQAKQARARSR